MHAFIDLRHKKSLNFQFHFHFILRDLKQWQCLLKKIYFHNSCDICSAHCLPTYK